MARLHHRVKHHLKNYFIPHEGNNHIPHALKPKRLLLHLSGAIAVKAIVVMFITFFPLSAWMSPDLAAQESKKIIALTNDLRVGLKLPALVENSKLDQAAANKVGDMLLNQYFAHVSPTGIDLSAWIKRVGYNYSMAGENLAMGFSTAPEVMVAWEKSPTHYANLTDPNFQDIGVAMATGRLKDVGTDLTAQYFARPTVQLAAAAIQPTEKKIVLPKESTTLTIKSPVAGAEKVLNVAVKLPESTATATAVVNNIKIDLAPQGSENTWQGNALVSGVDESAIANPLVPASVTMTDATGTTSLAALDWDSVAPVKTSAYDQYALFKQNPSSGMRSVLTFSNIYFGILLALLSIAFISFVILKKKQHHHILATSIASLVVVIMLIAI